MTNAREIQPSYSVLLRRSPSLETSAHTEANDDDDVSSCFNVISISNHIITDIDLPIDITNQEFESQQSDN